MPKKKPTKAIVPSKMTGLDKLVKQELETDKKNQAKKIVRKKLLEIAKTEKILTKLKDDLSDLLTRDLDDVIFDLDDYPDNPF